MTESLTKIKKEAPEKVLAGLLDSSPTASKEAGLRLVNEAKKHGIDLRSYLTLAVDPRLSEQHRRYHDGTDFLSGYEAALLYLNLPVKNDFKAGVVLQAASETFQTFPGTRALFPPVMDDVLKWKYRQDQIESIERIVGTSTTVPGVELITTVVDDKQEDYEAVSTVAELGRIPVKSIRATEYTVKFYKHGMGYRVSYEFMRRANLDLLTPYMARAQREFERSKVKAATYLLVNGDGVQPAAPVVNQSTLDSGATAGTISYIALTKWLVNMAKAGTPVDTVLGNYDAYFQWLALFQKPVVAEGPTPSDMVNRGGFVLGGVPLLQGVVTFALSSTVAANTLIGFSRPDTLQELVEAGSQIAESESSVGNQSMVFYRTENTGYKLVFPDTRSILNFGA